MIHLLLKMELKSLENGYLWKLNILEEQVTDLKKKIDSQSQFSTQRKRANESTKRLQFEIQSLKAQNVTFKWIEFLKYCFIPYPILFFGYPKQLILLLFLE